MADLAERVAEGDHGRQWAASGVDSSALGRQPRDDDASTVSVLQAALVELATANTDLERKVAVLEAAQTLPGEDAGDALCDTVLGTARQQDIDAAAAYLSGLQASVEEDQTPVTTPVKSHRKTLDGGTPPKENGHRGSSKASKKNRGSRDLFNKCA